MARDLKMVGLALDGSHHRGLYDVRISAKFFLGAQRYGKRESTRQKKKPTCAGFFNSFDPKGDFRPSP